MRILEYHKIKFNIEEIIKECILGNPKSSFQIISMDQIRRNFYLNIIESKIFVVVVIPLLSLLGKRDRIFSGNKIVQERVRN